MKFRTEYQPEKAYFELDVKRPVVLVGSCFTQNIAEKMRSCDWAAVNPLGNLYNPDSISKALRMMILPDDKAMGQFSNSLLLYESVWHSAYFDSTFSGGSREDCMEKFLKKREELLRGLERGKTLIITFGTSICYYKDGEIVGNCHKMPASLFTTGRLTIKAIRELWEETIKDLRERFPGLKMIFTVSPVRHLKNGFTGNSRSKAILQLGVEEICERVEGSHYFPAYEILNDDLRDYRFYATDLVHPSEEGIEYIWEKFRATYISSAGQEILKSGTKLVKSLSHRPILS